MLEQVLTLLGSVDAVWIYLILFFFSFIENIFPPSPSDVVVIVGASLISNTTLGFIPILLITSFGSSAGFILMYYMGKLFGDRILNKGKIKFLNQDDIKKTELWFQKYGYKLIIANRFLPGTRSVISFFSGVCELNIIKTFVAATISAFLWNILIIYLGITLGNNITEIDYYLATYSKIIILVTLILILFFIVRYFIKRKNVVK